MIFFFSFLLSFFLLLFPFFVFCLYFFYYILFSFFICFRVHFKTLAGDVYHFYRHQTQPRRNGDTYPIAKCVQDVFKTVKHANDGYPNEDKHALMQQLRVDSLRAAGTATVYPNPTISKSKSFPSENQTFHRHSTMEGSAATVLRTVVLYNHNAKQIVQNFQRLFKSIDGHSQYPKVPTNNQMHRVLATSLDLLAAIDQQMLENIGSSDVEMNCFHMCPTTRSESLDFSVFDLVDSLLGDLSYHTMPFGDGDTWFQVAGVVDANVFLSGAYHVIQPFVRRSVYPPNDNSYVGDPTAMWWALNGLGIAASNVNAKFTKQPSIFLDERKQKLFVSVFTHYGRLEHMSCCLDACFPGGTLNDRVVNGSVSSSTAPHDGYLLYPGLLPQSDSINNGSLPFTALKRQSSRKRGKNRKISYLVSPFLIQNTRHFRVFFNNLIFLSFVHLILNFNIYFVCHKVY